VERDEVLRIASLARLRLTEAELDRMTGDLNAILGHVDELSLLEAGQVAGGDEGQPARSTRAAEVTGTEPERLDPGSLAPAWREGFFVVPPPPGVHASEGGS
jgi:aspartyl-tRNA(Asn)/glutamyl-tRNA(Gln) amidotransferase subunit C